MNIEDLVVSLDMYNFAKDWEKTFISSIVSQIVSGNGLTEKQSVIAIRILKKHQLKMTTIFGDIEKFLENPVFRLPKRSTITNSYRASIGLDENNKKIIKLEFPFNQNIVDLIRQEKSRLNSSIFNKETKSWLIELNEFSIGFCMALKESFPFVVDNELQDLFDQTKSIIDNSKEFIPSLVLENGIPVYKNVSPYVPTLTTTDILTSVIEAKRAGINNWDDTIQKFIDSQDCIFKLLLNSKHSKSLAVDSEINEIASLNPVLKYLDPCLIIVPAGSELEKLQTMYEFLIKEGYTNQDMSVMFRLPSDTGKKFNNFIKNNQLNSPVSDKTKFIFICTKLPKPLIKSKIQINSVINLGYWNVHYTVKEFVKNCQNVVYYTSNKLIKDLHLADM